MQRPYTATPRSARPDPSTLRRPQTSGMDCPLPIHESMPASVPHSCTLRPQYAGALQSGICPTARMLQLVRGTLGEAAALACSAYVRVERMALHMSRGPVIQQHLGNFRCRHGIMFRPPNFLNFAIINCEITCETVLRSSVFQEVVLCSHHATKRPSGIQQSLQLTCTVRIRALPFSVFAINVCNFQGPTS